MFAQLPAFDFLSSRTQHALVVRLLLGGGVEAAVDGRVEGAAEGFADALVRISVREGERRKGEERKGSAYVDAYGCGFEILERARSCLLLLLLRGWSLGLRLAWYWGSLGWWGSAGVGEVVSALALGTTWVSVVVRLSLVLFPSTCEN